VALFRVPKMLRVALAMATDAVDRQGFMD